MRSENRIIRSFEVTTRAALGAALFALAVAHGGGTSQATSLGVPFAPHRAVYEMQLDEADAAKNIAGVEGRMVLNISGSPCAGYTVENRMVTRIVDAEGVEVVSDIHSSTWEHGEGDRFRFTSREHVDNERSKTIEGVAVRQDDGSLRITLQAPEETELRIDAEQVMFPTQFSLSILKAAHSGDRVLQKRLYDGSENGETLFTTTTFIGEAALPGDDSEASTKQYEQLADLRSWPVSISYFEVGAVDDSTPRHQLSFRLYENGVSRRLQIDYGSFALTGRLSSLTFHEAQPCPQQSG